MAKLAYMKPAFQFHQIPLVTGGGTGCAYRATHEEYVCPVTDPDLGVTIFASRPTCQYTTGGGNVCYNVPVADYNVYNS
ncbi:MAG: hypothetical protein IKD72_10565 [Clostridia bacterium]|nr:hypothetical protein [Clostridia bacterium]